MGLRSSNMHLIISIDYFVTADFMAMCHAFWQSVSDLAANGITEGIISFRLPMQPTYQVTKRLRFTHCMTKYVSSFKVSWHP